jgi:hypothetical protein
MVTGTLDRVTELKTALQAKAEEIKGLSESWKVEPDEKGNPGFVVSAEEHAKYLQAIKDGQEIKGLIDAEVQAKGLFDYLAEPKGTSTAAADAAETHRGEVKSLSQAFLGSESWQEAKGVGFRDPRINFAIERGLPGIARDIALVEMKDVYSAMGGTITIPGLGSAQNVGLTPRMLRPGRVRDLFPAESTTAAMLYGMRETGYTNRAAIVPERTASDGSAATGGSTDVYGLKPKSELTIVPVTYPIATIAHIMYVHKNVLADEPRMQGLLDRDMVDGVKMAEDEQLLYGDGVGDNLTGLLNTPGIQTYAGVNTDKKSAQIRRAMTRAILAYFQPTGVVMHPFEWEDIELETDKNGAYTVAVSVAVGGVKQVWRLNVVDTPAMQEGHFLVGAFGTGAKVYDREQVNIAISTENRDMFERNAVTLRAEERLGLVVDRPESFVYGSFIDYVAA